MPKSAKLQIVDHLFDLFWDDEQKKFTRTILANTELCEAKRWCREQLGIKMDPDRNRYNFMKDIVRGRGP